MTTASHIDRKVAEEAADWLLRWQEGSLNEAEQAAFQSWHSRSPMHARAWARAEQLMTLCEVTPAGMGRSALGRLRKLGRRQALRTFTALLIAAPLSWHATRQFSHPSADWHTGKGEQKAKMLSDGSQLVLNSNSSVNVVFGEAERQLLLHSGEILITTQPDLIQPPRPFRVKTAQGWVRALGTRFSVRQLDGHTRVSVFEHAVEMTDHAAGKLILQAGEQADMQSNGFSEVAEVLPTAAAWEDGFYVANRIRLADLVEELSRHRSGYLRCHPSVANLPVSGNFPIGNDNRALALLEKTLPLSISHFTRYWVMIEPE